MSSKHSREQQAAEQSTDCHQSEGVEVAASPQRTSDTFVGRGPELEALRDRIDRTRKGCGGLILVTGEAGIGKTRLIAEASAHAEATGLSVAWGHCNASAAQAFWPWLQIFRSIAGERIQASEPQAENVVTNDNLPWAMEYGAASRFKLFDSLAGILRSATDTKPLLVVLDDLQDADADSVALVEFIASDLDLRKNLVIVASYREEEVELSSNLQDPLLRILRTCAPTRICLQGLSVGEVEELVEASNPGQFDHEWTRQLQTRAGGNPFFVVETCKLESQWTRAPRRPPQPASTIRALTRQRLRRLSATGRNCLHAAAILGAEFDATVVATVLGISPLVRDKWIDEACSSGLIRQGDAAPPTHQFSHSIVRDCLYYDIPIAERRLLHRKTLAVLERRPSTGGSPTTDLLAHHAYLADDHCPYTKTADYLFRAGRDALSSLAYERAALHFDRALQRGLQNGSNLQTLCDLRLLLGEAQTKAGRWTEGRPTFEDALNNARQLCCPTRLAAAAIGMKGMTRGTLPPDRQAIRALREALAVAPDDNPELLARLLTALSTAIYFDHSRSQGESTQLAERATEAAIKTDNPIVVGDALEAKMFSAFSYDKVPQYLGFSHELEKVGAESDLPDIVFRAKIVGYSGLSQVNDARAATELRICSQLARNLRHPRYTWQVLLANASIALSKGDFESYAELSARVAELGKRFHDPTSFQHVLMLDFTKAKLCQEYERVIPALEEVVAMAPDYPLPRAGLAFMRAAAGNSSQASFALAPIVATGLGSIAPDGFALATLCILAETARYLGPASWVDELEDRLAPYENDSVVVGWGTAIEGSVAHFLSIIKVVQEEFDRAQELAEKAALVNQAMGYELLASRSYALLGFIRHLLGDHAGEAASLGAATYPIPDVPFPYLETGRSLCSGTNVVPEIPTPQKRDLPSKPVSAKHTLKREGEYWLIAYEEQTVRIKDCKGLRHISRLVHSPGIEFSAIDLVRSADGKPDQSSWERSSTGELPQPASDRAATAAYRQRLSEIRDDLAEAEDCADLGRIDALQHEKFQIEQHIARDAGLFGKPRATRTNSERARVNVRNAITASIRRISKSHPKLALHLDRSIKTGRLCSYLPERPMTWD